uniref:Uncharacterized protein n=1 Tax=Ixodes ricinus TaxID=34613 RepID=V5HLH3_IXORI
MEDVPVFSLTDYIVMGLMLCVSSGIGVFFAVRDRRDQSNKTFLAGQQRTGRLSCGHVSDGKLPVGHHGPGLTRTENSNYKGTQFWMAIFGLALSNVIAAELLCRSLQPTADEREFVPGEASFRSRAVT